MLTKTVTVDYATSNGTATAGSDYTATSDTLTFSAGETSKTIAVTVLADALDEANETVTMTLSSASNATISDSTGTFTLLMMMQHHHYLLMMYQHQMKVMLLQHDSNTYLLLQEEMLLLIMQHQTDTATAGSDYTATSDTLTISAGDTTGTIGVTVLS